MALDEKFAKLRTRLLASPLFSVPAPSAFPARDDGALRGPRGTAHDASFVWQRLSATPSFDSVALLYVCSEKNTLSSDLRQIRPNVGGR